MSVIITGNKVHDDALRAAEHARQTTLIGAFTQAQAKAADVQYARSAIASCKQNNSSAGVEQFVDMLRELGLNA
jgi:hypothetical protein